MKESVPEEGGEGKSDLIRLDAAFLSLSAALPAAAAAATAATAATAAAGLFPDPFFLP